MDPFFHHTSIYYWCLICRGITKENGAVQKINNFMNGVAKSSKAYADGVVEKVLETFKYVALEKGKHLSHTVCGIGSFNI